MGTKDTTEIRFKCRDQKGLTPDAQRWLARLEKEVRMTVRQYLSIDQSDPRHVDFIEKVAGLLRPECRTAVECRRRLLCSPCTAPSASEGHVCDDVLVEIIVDGHLVAMQYQRRTDSNCTETTEIIL